MLIVTRFLLALYSFTPYIREQLLVTVFGYKSVCKHHPTCSEYAKEQIAKKGVLQGGLVGVKRVITCW